MSAPNPYPNVLRPIELGPVELRNRVVSTSHQTSLVQDHVPTDDLVAYQEARARGGVGAVFLEATAVHPTGLLTAHTIGGYLPEIVPAAESEFSDETFEHYDEHAVEIRRFADASNA